ncbi:MAG: class I SAM-dependent methyltransferase [Bacteroidota bacterium]
MQTKLTAEKETLLITLCAKASDYRDEHSILNDKIASDIVENAGIDVKKYGGFGNRVIVVRARQYDEWVKEFLASNKNSLVVYMGCGMDARVKRLDLPPNTKWFDVDYPEVITFRKEFFTENDRYRMISSSITQPDWFREIPADRPTLIIAEGVFEYMTKEEVQVLLNRLTDHFRHGEIMFDVMNTFAINSGKEELKKTTGAIHKWAVDDVKDVDALNKRLTRVDYISLFKSKFMKKLPLNLRIILGTVSIFPSFRKSMQLLRYKF